MKKIFIILFLFAGKLQAQNTFCVGHYCNDTVDAPRNNIPLVAYPTGTKVLSRSWTQVFGTNATLTQTTNPDSVIAGNLQPGKYVFLYTAISVLGQKYTGFDTVTVIPAANIPPTVVISKDTIITAPQTNFILDASKSFDTDGKIVSYQWSGVGVTALSGPFAYIKNPTTNIYSCTITDDAGGKTTASFKLTVSPAVVIPIKTITLYSDGTIK